MLVTLIQKFGMVDGTLLVKDGRRNDRGLRRSEGETTTMAGCLVDIPDILGTNPILEFKASGPDDFLLLDLRGQVALLELLSPIQPPFAPRCIQICKY